MKLIRNSVFETNSSSCHSISVDDGATVFESFTPNEYGHIIVEPMDFGWDRDTYRDVHSKLSYLLIYIRDWVHNGSTQAIFKKRLDEVVFEHTGATALILNEMKDPNSYLNGYIDHQSVEDGNLHWMFAEDTYKQTLKNFVFSRQSCVETDNDNY